MEEIIKAYLIPRRTFPRHCHLGFFPLILIFFFSGLYTVCEIFTLFKENESFEDYHPPKRGDISEKYKSLLCF